MRIRSLLFGVLGFVVGALTVVAYGVGPQPARDRIEPKAPPVQQQPVINEEFEAIERRLRDPRDPEWNLIQDMQPCFPGSRLCFLLSGAPPGRDR